MSFNVGDQIYAPDSSFPFTMARILGERPQSESVSYRCGSFSPTRRAHYFRSSYKIANEAQSNQEFRRRATKEITVKGQQFVETADLDSLTRLLSDGLNEATGGQEKHAHNQQIMGKVGKTTIAFANNFSSFLQAYSGIVEIMQGADQQYGGVAYSTLSLLLIVRVSSEIKVPLID